MLALVANWMQFCQTNAVVTVSIPPVGTASVPELH
jgi:hypothetical protein